jgi:hypothetical protein
MNENNHQLEFIIPGTRQMLLTRGDISEPFKFPGTIELKPGETITFHV